MDRWRGMPTAQTGRHLSNDVEPEVVEALRNAVVAAYPKLSHRYYELKRKWLGLDRDAGLGPQRAPADGSDAHRSNWPTARGTNGDERVLGVRHRVWARSPSRSSTKGWIDAAVKPGKAPGAFAHPTVTDVHPYVMLNYLGKPRDVMTLAHELGHGVHQVLAAEQGETARVDAADPRRNRLGLRRNAHLPQTCSTTAKDDAETQGAARGQGRGHDQHGRAPDRVLRFRM